MELRVLTRAVVLLHPGGTDDSQMQAVAALCERRRYRITVIAQGRSRLTDAVTIVSGQLADVVVVAWLPTDDEWHQFAERVTAAGGRVESVLGEEPGISTAAVSMYQRGIAAVTIADVLTTDVGTVRAWLARARVTLRRTEIPADGETIRAMTTAIDASKASPSRMDNYVLGGIHHFEVDRQTADAVAQRYPWIPAASRDRRAFVTRVVRFLAGEGVAQILDLGSGIPTMGYIHETAHQTSPHTKVVYVDHDPVTVALSQEILAGDPRSSQLAAVCADIRTPQAIFDHPDTRRLLDFAQPVAVVAVPTLTYITDAEDPDGIVAALRTPLTRGSYLALSQACTEAATPAEQDAYQRLDEGLRLSLNNRSRTHVESWFGPLDAMPALDVVPPGFAPVTMWRPDDADAATPDMVIPVVSYAGVGRVP